MNSTNAYSSLQSTLRAFGRVAVAFSGGVDSTFLLKAAADTLGPANVLAVIGDSPSLPRREKAEAERLAASFGVETVVVQTGEMNNPHYAANPENRCYYCKQVLMAEVRKQADARGITAVLDGQNVDDLGDWRPGSQASRECGVYSPIQEAGLTKADIRLLSERLGLSTARKPAMACLASRLPYGTPVTAEALRQIETAEQSLQDAGFATVRVRHHGTVARVEVNPDDFPRLLDPALRARIVAAVKSAGFTYAALDLDGYRSGSLNAERLKVPRP